MAARRTYENHFDTVIKLLAGSITKYDTPWRNARRMLTFPEVKYTCLGYGAGSVSGSGQGRFTTDNVIQTAKEIVNLGIDDPDLFVAMGLFEEGIGPDMISDMTTNVIMPDLLAFNARILGELQISTSTANIELKNGATYIANLPINPFIRGGTSPVILVPADVLRELPVASDWSDVGDVAVKNSALRKRVNEQIAAIWKRKSKKDKDVVRAWALESGAHFRTCLELLRTAKGKPYDLAADPLGELIWRKVLDTIATTQPFTLAPPPVADAAGVANVVAQIIEQFRFLIEDRRFSEELYQDGAARPEKAAQRLFFAVAYAYCKANNLDITPEADTGNGPMDFKVSSGFTGRVLAEIKLSTNSKVVAGYTKQLETYKGAEETTRGFYVVIDVGGMGKKDEELIKAKNAQVAAGKPTSQIIIIDGTRRASA